MKTGKWLEKCMGRRLGNMVRRLGAQFAKAHSRAARAARRRSLQDCRLVLEHSSELGANTRGKALARLILAYHIVEKELTMPGRRMGFGRARVLSLMDRIETFEAQYGTGESQAKHAAGVVRAYAELHDGWDGKSADKAFWNRVDAFVGRRKDIPAARQWHGTREAFFADRNQAFPAFARSRHSVRDYESASVPLECLRDAVELATTAPSACNRQYTRVHCVTDKTLIGRILTLQNGNHGFGHLADKLLVVTADLEGVTGTNERHDLFTNGGMFLMNLCYALHWHGIGHCILNWSTPPASDAALRKLLPLKDSERVVALLTCGIPPPEFDVTASPRKKVSEVFVTHGMSPDARE